MRRLIAKRARRSLRSLRDLILLLTVARGSVPVVFFDRQLNVGDAITPYLVQKLTGKPVYRVRSNVVVHLLAVGSIIHEVRCRSLVWGSGILDAERLPGRDTLERARFLAVRGRLTQQLLAASGADVAAAAIGDPAVVMPLFYEPKRSDQAYRIGLVPHYVDRETPLVRYMASLPGISLIDVSQQPEPFIDDICQCELVVSSSLHGLILADSYRVPNLWVRFSDGLVGGEFKFHDYYSTTDAPDSRITLITDQVAADECIAALPKQAGVARYLGDPEDLIAAFPFNRFDRGHAHA